MKHCVTRVGAARLSIAALILLAVVLLRPVPQWAAEQSAQAPGQTVTGPTSLVVGIGDSLTHGTMDAANNLLYSFNAYLQRVVNGLRQEFPVWFRQPFFDVQETRLSPFVLPTNLGVDGADAFTVEGLEYYKRVGADESLLSLDLLADKVLPATFADNYDKVIYPINLALGVPTSQMDAAAWLVNTAGALGTIDRALVFFWIGNNDSSLAALGFGGANPEFLPVPIDEIGPEIDPLLFLLAKFGESLGLLSFEPYTQASIERNLTELDDFTAQMDHLLARLLAETAGAGLDREVFLLTLPYYSAVGYLFDSEDIEFYLRKVDPAYTVPASFQRVTPPGVPIEDPLAGDRVALLTFGLMYTLLATGHSVADVNEVLELDGVQRDGLVVSEAEQQLIMARIDAFNDAIQDLGDTDPHVQVLDIGQLINDAFLGVIEIIVDGHQLTRKWGRGGSFSLDGVHPGFTAQALLANFLLEQLNPILGIQAPLEDLGAVRAADPYADQDGDGWVPGPSIEPPGIAELLFLFADPDDQNPVVQVELPPDVWDIISAILLDELLRIAEIRAEAERLGYVPEPENQ